MPARVDRKTLLGYANYAETLALRAQVEGPEAVYQAEDVHAIASAVRGGAERPPLLAPPAAKQLLDRLRALDHEPLPEIGIDLKNALGRMALDIRSNHWDAVLKGHQVLAETGLGGFLSAETARDLQDAVASRAADLGMYMWRGLDFGAMALGDLIAPQPYGPLKSMRELAARGLAADVVRPLLGFDRAEIVGYVGLRGQAEAALGRPLPPDAIIQHSSVVKYLKQAKAEGIIDRLPERRRDELVDHVMLLRLTPHDGDDSGPHSRDRDAIAYDHMRILMMLGAIYERIKMDASQLDAVVDKILAQTSWSRLPDDLFLIRSFFPALKYLAEATDLTADRMVMMLQVLRGAESTANSQCSEYAQAALRDVVSRGGSSFARSFQELIRRLEGLLRYPGWHGWQEDDLDSARR